MKFKIAVLLLVVILSIAVLSGCSFTDRSEQPAGETVEKNRAGGEIADSQMSEEEREEKKEEIKEQYADDEIQQPIEEGENFAGQSPFTGEMLKEIKYKHAISVSIENSPVARPQSGLESAEIVYEFMLEGGITRFLAIFWPEIPEKVGPIRSARPFLIDVANSYDSLFLHAGASPDGFKQLSDSGILHLDQIYQNQYFWRSSKRLAPHNLYSGKIPLQDFTDKLDRIEYPNRFKFLTASIVSNPQTAEEITIDYWGDYSVNYRYDEEANIYYRFLYDFKTPHRVENGRQLSAKNIIVQFTDTEVKDDEGRLEMDLNKGGKALLFRDGIVVSGNWQKNDDSWIIYYDKNGSELEINPGQTWIQVVPDGTEIKY
ncbi:DUF3048 family protein [Halanaerobium sp. DL-01]|uniref:DUF3048 domain-containing protein n=1 Tax=Halanaerobium sp. DL-01 TaxID=1653064 RepID=UPI000DF3F9B1|nr:DUF3048 domain-containing protein [Halanaerobium sp. DL-01]RCW82561.1 DUF3048 family protein [Halanaerobium sp. DL-01]